MRTVVTGGAGFIGSTLADALLAAGHEVTVVDDLSRGRREHVPADVGFVDADVAAGSLRGLFERVRPEVVFHQAAQIDVRRSVAEPVFDARVNVAGTVNVLDAAAHSGVRRVVFASSGGAVYGDTETIPTPESHPCSPLSAYGAAKYAGEVYGEMFQRLHGLEFVALRYANVYGPRQDPHGEAGVVAIFIERLLGDGEVLVHGDGAQTRDYVHVADVVRANLLAATGSATGAYNIGTGREHSVNDVYAATAAALGVTRQPRHGPAKAGEQRRSCVDVSRAAAELGWTPSTNLDAGISQTVAWFTARRPGG